jgi:hypothetical protein
VGIGNRGIIDHRDHFGGCDKGMTIPTKIKTVSSTSKVDFQNISNSYYDMIISIQYSPVNQSINFVDTEGNQINDQPIVLTQSCKIILKDIQLGSISFSDPYIYSILISYSVKRESQGIPYIDFDFATANVNSLSRFFAFYGKTSATANTNLPLVDFIAGQGQFFSELTISADSANTDSIILNEETGSSLAEGFHLKPGQTITIKNINLDLIYAYSAGATQIYYIIGGGA